MFHKMFSSTDDLLLDHPTYFLLLSGKKDEAIQQKKMRGKYADLSYLPLLFLFFPNTEWGFVAFHTSLILHIFLLLVSFLSFNVVICTNILIAHLFVISYVFLSLFLLPTPKITQPFSLVGHDTSVVLVLDTDILLCCTCNIRTYRKEFD